MIEVRIADDWKLVRKEDMNWVAWRRYSKRVDGKRGGELTGEMVWRPFSYHPTPGAACKMIAMECEDDGMRGTLEQFRQWFERRCGALERTVNGALERGAG